MVVKALRNAVLYGAYAGVSEAADVARRTGIDADELVAALRNSGASGSAALAFLGYRADWQRGEHAGTPEREGFVELARKDLGVARQVAAAVGVDATFTGAVADAMPAAYLTEP
jgi:3-hydroxyisobutyrate dehydrogenase-like beta-hydroxyacid dehydrogenase